MSEEESAVRRQVFVADRGAENDVLRMIDKLEELLESAPHFLNKAWSVDIEEFFVLTNRRLRKARV